MQEGFGRCLGSQMIYLYNLLVVIIVIFLVLPGYFVRLFREAGFGQRFRQSFGLWTKSEIRAVADRGCIWLHAASVGEIVATSPVVKVIRQEFPDTPLLISVVTSAGYEMAKRIIPDADAIIYFPVDLPLLSYRLQKLVNPKVVMLVETELWPNFLRYSKLLNIPVMIINGRISDKSVKNYRYLLGILQKMLNCVQKYCMQSVIDAQYIISLGADPRKVVVTGNTKFDQTYTTVTAQEQVKLFQEFFTDNNQPVIIAGSTHKGEEELIIGAFKEIRRKIPRAGLVLAPRDIMRAEEIFDLAAENNLVAVKRTMLDKRGSGTIDIVVLDTIGELGRVYSIGDIIFIGGSLIRKGGHNLLEPAAHGKPILVGPHMFNFKDIYALLEECGACKTVYDMKDLACSIITILEDSEIRGRMSECAAAVITANQGAAQKSVDYLKQLLAERGVAVSRQEKYNF